MALRGTLNHRKTRKLARLLGIPPCFALGILEAMWHVTAALFPTGAIGRMPNEEIADQLGYTDDADHLVACLVEAGLLDEHRGHRLIVHDWHEHSDNTLDAALYRKGERYANGSIPRGKKLGSDEKAVLFERFYKQPPASLFGQQEDVDRAAAEATDLPTNVIPFVAAPCGAVRRLPEPVPVPVPEPVTTPLPPAVRRGDRRSALRAMERTLATPNGQSLQRASQHVLTALRMTGTYGLRAQVAIVMAIDAECKRVDKSPESAAMEIAERMVQSWTDYLQVGTLLRFQWHPPKFFEGGHWADDRTWPWDQQRIAQQRNARIGMR